MDTNLAQYVGRTFILQHTKHAMLDGCVLLVKAVERVPWGDGQRDVLVGNVLDEDFPASVICLPHQFRQEVPQ